MHSITWPLSTWCQPVHSCIESSLCELDFFFLWRLSTHSQVKCAVNTWNYAVICLTCGACCITDPPVIHHGKDNTTLVCHLNHTVCCNNLMIVFFIKEEKNITKNVTVGNCFKDSVQTHHRLRFYFNESSIDGIDCIMDFSSSPSPRDNGRYHCVVWILNEEKNLPSSAVHMGMRWYMQTQKLHPSSLTTSFLWLLDLC